jgi:hypothetical protein
LELSETFSLKLHLDDGRGPINIKSKVIWTNQYGLENEYLKRGMGVKFLDLADEDRNRIQKYIDINEKEPKGEILLK